MSNWLSSKELRVGNIALNGEGEYYTVNETTFVTVKDNTLHLFGVQLTKDLLQKCKFKESAFEYRYYSLHITDKGTYLLINPEDGGAKYGNYRSSCECDGFAETQFYTADTFFLHQLQNLYFMLTGEELTIKL